MRHSICAQGTTLLLDILVRELRYPELPNLAVDRAHLASSLNRRKRLENLVFHRVTVTSVTASTASDPVRLVSGSSGLRVPVRFQESGCRAPHLSPVLREVGLGTEAL